MKTPSSFANWETTTTPSHSLWRTGVKSRETGTGLGRHWVRVKMETLWTRETLDQSEDGDSLDQGDTGSE